MADKDRLAQALANDGGDLVDYAAIRQQVRSVHDKIVKGGSSLSSYAFGANSSNYADRYTSSRGTKLKMYEVFEWYQPYKDFYSVIVGASRVPIFKDGYTPIPFDFKEAPFIETTYLKIPGEFEGYGIPLILENPQIMLNLIKNQRLDAATLSIHKMWIVNPLANISKNELVTRPFGIIYSIDPNGVREVQFSDIKASAYKEEEMLKSDMRYSSGVDDFSMGVGGQATSATEVRHLRESTLERVRLFVNHLGDSYSDVLRYWMDMARQLMTKSMTIRIIGDDGQELYPIIEKDDLMGFFDYKAKVLPSIAGMQDVNKKQAMDLFQVLSQIDPQMSGIDMKKLIAKTITNWGWSLDSISSSEQDPNVQQQPGMDPSMQGMDPAMMDAMQQGGMAPDASGMQQMMAGGGAMPPGGATPPPEAGTPGGGSLFKPQFFAPNSFSKSVSMLRSPAEMAQSSPFSQAASPVNLLQSSGPPPTPKGVPSASGGPGKKKPNPRGLNRGGKVNTNIPTSSKSNNSSTESNLLNRVFNLQR